MQIGGMNTSFAIPLFMLPYHRHLLPAQPTEKQKQEQSHALDQAEGQPQRAQAQAELTKLKQDVAEIAFSVHAALPIHMDQSLLDLLAEMGKVSQAPKSVTVDPDRKLFLRYYVVTT